MIGRLMKATAHPGRGPELTALMLRVAESLRGYPGCEIYTIAHDAADPDTIRIIEVWHSDEAAQAALTATPAEGAPKPADVMALLAAPLERIDIVVAGGVGVE
ncbi:MAG TPA: antibiotic biosynthesis monooxygenase family protein [Actinospica sp.]|nr:antibiotic biosynthesis monooxygenase family protein [Actinospica sp.]